MLGVDAIPVALGIYFVFRDAAQAEAFRACRCRSRTTAPRIRLRVNKFEEYLEQPPPLMDFYSGRPFFFKQKRMLMLEVKPVDEIAGFLPALIDRFVKFRAFLSKLVFTREKLWEKACVWSG